LGGSKVIKGKAKRSVKNNTDNPGIPMVIPTRGSVQSNKEWEQEGKGGAFGPPKRRYRRKKKKAFVGGWILIYVVKKVIWKDQGVKGIIVGRTLPEVAC